MSANDAFATPKPQTFETGRVGGTVESRSIGHNLKRLAVCVVSWLAGGRLPPGLA